MLESKPPFTEVALEAVRRIQTPLLLYGVIETVLLVGLLTIGRDVPDVLIPIVYSLPILVGTIAVAHLALEYGKQQIQPPAQLDATIGLALLRVFRESDSVEFHGYVQERMLKADRLVLIGTGLNILEPVPFVNSLMSRIAGGNCRLEIYLADPTNPAIETRLIEEELGDEFGDKKPAVGQTGIHDRLATLLKFRQRLRA